jgi:hypothetical protein
MSFDLFLIAFQNGKNGLGDASAARKVLDRLPYTHEAQSNHYDIRFPDGSHVELSSGGLHNEEKFDGAMFILRAGSLSPTVMQLIYDFALAGRLAVFPAMDPPLVLLPLSEMLNDLPPDVLQDIRPINFSSGQELGILLSRGFRAWEQYRDQVISGHGER